MIQQRQIAKRRLDLLIASIAIVLTIPIMVVVALCVWWTMEMPILFRQRRPGLNGKPFTILKFRTMNAGEACDAERITRLGAFLRQTSLDELPELWNVIRGEMSLVGPRPLLMEYLDRYSPEQWRRHEVLPGITGWAQVNGRNALPWDQRLMLDVWYVDHRSFWLDAKILFGTLPCLWTRHGIRHGAHATMPQFLGTLEPQACEFEHRSTID
jgi:sugar transferase EpsL